MTELAQQAPPREQRTDPVQLLWTGGWDSSFRLMQLLLVERRAVQPIYVLSTERISTPQELRAMRLMREELLRRMPDPSLLAPTSVVIGEEYPERPDFVAMRWRIKERAKVGYQYVMLAAVAEALGWRGVEICMQAHDEGPTDLHRVLFTDTRGTLSDNPEAQLFKYWSFPVLATTKTEMARIAREHGFLDLLLQRWFCHDPLLGEPCGWCHPCELALREGFEFANPLLVRVRGRYRRADRALARLDERLPLPGAQRRRRRRASSQMPQMWWMAGPADAAGVSR